MSELERDVVAHYAREGLLEVILDALQASGADLDHLTSDVLAPVDEFHIGGRSETSWAASKLGLGPGDRVLDVGCGIGETARYLASTYGVRATGVDLTPEYVSVATELTRRTGMDDRVQFVCASALALPFPDAHFHAVITIHAAMNIADRVALYRELGRVTAGGGPLCLFDVMRMSEEPLTFPVPWAESAETSYLCSPDEMSGLLREAGFSVELREDRREAVEGFFERVRSAPAPPPLGTHLLMGPSAKSKFSNMYANIKAGRIAPVLMLARKGR